MSTFQFGQTKSSGKIRVFKTKIFARFARKEDLTDDDLLTAIEEIEKGMVDAKLGANVYKKRIGINGRGKSGGIRTIVCYKMGNKAFFVDGFKKNDKDNLSNKELAENQALSEMLFDMNDMQIQAYIKQGGIEEISWEKPNTQTLSKKP